MKKFQEKRRIPPSNYLKKARLIDLEETIKELWEAGGGGEGTFI